jgi:hypothetical protein
MGSIFGGPADGKKFFHRPSPEPILALADGLKSCKPLPSVIQQKEPMLIFDEHSSLGNYRFLRVQGLWGISDSHDDEVIVFEAENYIQQPLQPVVTSAPCIPFRGGEANLIGVCMEGSSIPPLISNFRELHLPSRS